MQSIGCAALRAALRIALRVIDMLSVMPDLIVDDDSDEWLEPHFNEPITMELDEDDGEDE
jgi:hypothetical protein